MPDHRNTYPSTAARLVLVVWMLSTALIFVLVSLPAESKLMAAVPAPLLILRDILLPLFQAPALY